MQRVPAPRSGRTNRRKGRRSPARTPSSISSKSRIRRPTRRSRAPWRVLVVQGQADELQRQGLALGSLVSAVVWSAGETARLDINERGGLEVGLRLLGRRVFRAVAIVAHSNADGVRLANDEFVSWADLARRLRRTRVEKLLLIACRAGVQSAAEVLFHGVPTLRRIYACPDLLALSQARPVTVMAPWMLGEDDIPDEIRVVLQGLYLLHHDGLFFEYRREELATADGRGRAALKGLAAVVLKQLKTS